MRGAVARALDLLLPAGCASCRMWMPRPEARDAAPICTRCRSRLRMASWPRCDRCHAPLGSGPTAPTRAARRDCHECRSWPTAISSARSAFVLAGPAADLVHALKYEGWHELAGFMAERMAVVMRESVHEIRPATASDPQPVITAVPTTPVRERRRGYNQAALLAQGVASALDLPLQSLLDRPVDRRSQVELEPSQRRANVRGVFVPHPTSGALRGRAVVLVDDVLTTGATASEAATVLAAQGAGSVTLVTFARALPEEGSLLS